MYNRLREEWAFYENENKHLNNYRDEAESIINTLSKKVVNLETEISDIKGDPYILEFDKLILDSSPNSKMMLNSSPKSKIVPKPSPFLDDDLELDTNFVKRAASITLLDKMKRVYRKTCNQGTLTELKDIDKHVVVISDKEYQNYRKDMKVKSTFCLYNI